MDLSVSETYLKYALGLCGLILLIALYKVFKRGKQALYLVGAILSFALLLGSLYLVWHIAVTYIAGFCCAFLLVLDAKSRPPRGS